MRIVSLECQACRRSDRSVHDLPWASATRIEIVHALRIRSFDHGRADLGAAPQEVAKLFTTLRRLAKEGCSILYISHKLEEIKALCDRATIMRMGRVVAECDPRLETAQHLAELMIGTELKAPRHGRRAEEAASARLTVQGLQLASDQQFGTDLKDISLRRRRRRDPGHGGIAGNGRTS
jgi:simple sugar transport system ATP-binding protein